jgi:hypothetical protein
VVLYPGPAWCRPVVAMVVVVWATVLAASRRGLEAADMRPRCRAVDVVTAWCLPLEAVGCFKRPLPRESLDSRWAGRVVDVLTLVIVPPGTVVEPVIMGAIKVLVVGAAEEGGAAFLWPRRSYRPNPAMATSAMPATTYASMRSKELPQLFIRSASFACRPRPSRRGHGGPAPGLA